MSKRSLFLSVVTLVALLGVMISASSASPIAKSPNQPIPLRPRRSLT